jgi:branched-chain amino acid aminotransferase
VVEKVIAYLNGEYLPHEEAKISIDDRGIILGDSVFDVTRTYGGTPFRVEDHLERLRRSLRYIEMDADPIVDEVREAIAGIVGRNRDEIAEAGDVWIDQVVTRGAPRYSSIGSGISSMLDLDGMRPTVIVKLRKMKFEMFGDLYERGVDLNISLLNRHFAGPMDPRVKAANRLSATRAELKGVRQRRAGGQHWTVVFGSDGSIAETAEANVCIVSDGRLVRPPRHELLEGVALKTLCELAATKGIDVEERPIYLYDLLNADETMLTATSVSVLPVNSIDGIPLRTNRNVYSALVQAWIELIGFDFVTQARAQMQARIDAREREMATSTAAR